MVDLTLTGQWYTVDWDEEFDVYTAVAMPIYVRSTVGNSAALIDRCHGLAVGMGDADGDIGGAVPVLGPGDLDFVGAGLGKGGGKNGDRLAVAAVGQLAACPIGLCPTPGSASSAS
jgi:hypothetical protein